ncbi:MAG: DUF4340 domain-containing protein [Alphaproteobacteria bacterium]|nr:DUF4340 domain-containing protein [Alphaproteobacteria bacterium]
MDVLKLFKKTIFWFFTLAALFGASLLIEDWIEETERVEEANLKLLPFEIDEVAEFWIKTGKNEIRARVAREKDGWWLDQPLVAKGDDEGIAKMLNNIVKSRKDAVLFENPDPAKLVELGLAEPSLEITFRTGKGLTTLQFGNQGPTLNVTYGRFAGDAAVYRIHSDVRREADATVYTLRDKSTLAYDPLKLSRLEIAGRAKDTVVIVHDRGRWDMIQPENVPADHARVLEVLYAIKDTPVKAFIDEEPADLAPYGLEAPIITVTIREQGAKDAQILRIGNKDRKLRGYFAKSNRARNVVLLEENLVHSILADKDHWKEAG